MKIKLYQSLIFSLAALCCVPFILLMVGLIGGQGLNGIYFLIRHTEIFVPYLLIPSLCAFVSALVARIKQGKSWIIISVIIVVISLLLWACIMSFYFTNLEKWQGFYLAFIAVTVYSWALFPLALLAGLVVKQRLFLKQNHKTHSNQVRKLAHHQCLSNSDD